MTAATSTIAAPAAIAASHTELGYVAVAVLNGEVMAVSFGHRTIASAMQRVAGIAAAADGSPYTPADADEQLAQEVRDRLVRYAAGKPVDFSDIPTSVSHLSPFQRRVVKACRAIPHGQTRTYGQLAASAGSPAAARAVGQVMASNRNPLIVPCHRVLGAGGRLGGFSAPDGLAMKRRLLKMESQDALV
jgi:methylated-DNA-[protein]-cysteine S-methyltransferase